jgi:Serine dehydrogenase proteinase
MPTWGEILREITQSTTDRGAEGPDFDGIRLKYIRQLRELSGRAIIVYASAWLQQGGAGNQDYLVEARDVHAMMEVCHGVEERELDLIIHSPGGNPQAAEQMMNYLRTQFDYIRAIVPLQAKSAATMIALGCDEIVMGLHSEVGPIDPQILIPVPGGGRYAPAHAILRDFERAKAEIARDLTALPAWTPILHAYAGGLLEFCTQQIRLSQEIVAGWLKQHMLSHADTDIDPTERDSIADVIADFFGSDASYDRLRTHGRPIRIEELKKIRGLRVRHLEDDDSLQDTVLSIYHVLDFTFGGNASKIVENHLPARYVRLRTPIQMQPRPSAPAAG